MEEMLIIALDEMGLTAKGWEAGDYGDSLICPCGNEIELDGRCPEGCESPLTSFGLI